jgi:hypothetical protein
VYPESLKRSSAARCSVVWCRRDLITADDDDDPDYIIVDISSSECICNG